mgnify:CR=1 FL=1
MSNGGDSSSSGNDSVSADVEAGLATESMSDYSVSEGGTGGDNEEYNAVMKQYGPGKNTSPKTSGTYDAGGLDPAVPSPYTDIGTKKTSYINPNDTGSNLTNNLRANVASQTSTPTGTLGTVFKVLTNPVGYVIGQTTKAAYQTAKFNNAMGRPMTQGILDVDGLVTTGTDGKTINQTMQDIRDSGDNVSQQIDSVRTVDTASTGLPDPSSFIHNFVGSKSYIQDLYTDVKSVLNTPRSRQGLLAVSDSPYYDFLKSNKLNRRIL